MADAASKTNTKQNLPIEREHFLNQITWKQWCQVVATTFLFLIICCLLHYCYYNKIESKIKIKRELVTPPKIVRGGYFIYFKDGKDHTNDPPGSAFVESMSVMVGFTAEYFTLMENASKLKNRTDEQMRIYNEWIERPEFKAAVKEGQEIEREQTKNLRLKKPLTEYKNKKSESNGERKYASSDLDKTIKNKMISTPANKNIRFTNSEEIENSVTEIDIPKKQLNKELNNKESSNSQINENPVSPKLYKIINFKETQEYFENEKVKEMRDVKIKRDKRHLSRNIKSTTLDLDKTIRELMADLNETILLESDTKLSVGPEIQIKPKILQRQEEHEWITPTYFYSNWTTKRSIDVEEEMFQSYLSENKIEDNQRKPRYFWEKISPRDSIEKVKGWFSENVDSMNPTDKEIWTFVFIIITMAVCNCILCHCWCYHCRNHY